ncbi:putative p-loop containing nucleoside triphosphate hydrolase [Haemophilus haemolyticus M21639]|nr:putative p-loop containing nucleoside triphosphate hydrolase [Haemophilus haemolyticus M21639]
MALLEIKNLVKNYGDVEALKGISFSVEKGEVVVILGPSGCG